MAKTKLDKPKKSLASSLAPLKTLLLEKTTFLVIIILSLIIGLWAYYNSHMVYVPRDEAAYQLNLDQSKPPTFSSETIKKIESLKVNNVQNPGTDYSKDRTNPFAE